MTLFRRFAFGLGLAAMALNFGTGLLRGDDDEFGKPSPNDRQAARIVAILMEREHLLGRPIDDQMSERALGQFIKMLDPMKTYFLASDIEEFGKYAKKFDDAIRDADFSIAFAIFGRFRERLDQCTALANRWLDAEHDFTVDEEMINEPDLLKNPADENELSERWRQRIKYNLLVAMAEDKALEEAKARKAAEAAANPAGQAEEATRPAPPRLPPVERLKKRYQSTARRMQQMDNDDVVEMFVTAITTSFDPHTTYMSRKNYQNFMIVMGLKLEGIGATLQADDEGYTVIKRIVPKGPADKQGELKVEDRIAGVGQGDTGEMVDVTGWKLDDVVSRIRGEAGTVVRLSVIDPTGSDIREIRIVRDKVELEDEAASGKVFEHGTRPDGTPLKIGVIDLPSFYADMENPNRAGARSTTRDVARILEDFNKDNVDALVLDLRRNGGGSLREAIDCTGLFIDQGTVVQVKDPGGQIEQLNDLRRGALWSKPMVVLTSKLSASASEILAGAVQDFGRGLVIGDTTTHGKGTVQSMVDLNSLVYQTENPPNNFGALKISTSQFYRPNGDSTQLRGVLSDIVLPSITDKMDVAESDLDFAVDFDKIPAAQIAKLDLNSQGLVQSLAEKSRSRVQSNSEFAREQKKIDLYVQFKERTGLTLNRDRFFEQRAEFNAEEEDRQQMEEQLNPEKEGIRKDYYLEEVLSIAADYANALGAG